MAPKAAAWAVQCAREPLATPEEKALGQQVTREPPGIEPNPGAMASNLMVMASIASSKPFFLQGW